MPKRYSFVSIEGLSGSGKTTVSRALAEELGAQWYTTPPSMFRPIRDAVQAKASPFVRYLYYFAGIAQASAEIALLRARQPVVCDKYIATMLAYARAAGIKTDVPLPGLIVEPDFAFLLTIPNALRLERLASRGGRTPARDEFVRQEIALDVIHYFRDLKVIEQDNSSGDVTATVAAIRQYMQCACEAKGGGGAR